MTSRTKLSAAALAVIGATSCLPENPEQGWSALVLPEPLPKPDLVLTDQHGQPFDLREETSGSVTLLFFGYTHCPDICPLQMANVAAALGELPAETAGSISVVFVTTDPERDTTERLDAWLSAIHPDFVGLRGPLEEVHAAEASLLLPRSTIQALGEEDYTVGHASRVVAFGADGSSRLMFSAETTRVDYARDLARLVDRGTP